MPAPEFQTDFQGVATDDVNPNNVDDSGGNEADGTEGPTKVENEKTARKKEEAIRQTKEMARLVGNDEFNKMTRFVKQFKPNVNVSDPNDPLRPPLFLVACQRNNLKMAELLLSVTEHPADVNAADVTGLRPLGFAVETDNAELVELLLADGKYDCDVNYFNPRTHCTPLHRAVTSNSPAICRLLINGGADVNAQNPVVDETDSQSEAESLLMTAVRTDNVAICRLLLAAECKVDARSKHRLTSLHLAVSLCRYTIAELLLRNGCNVQPRSDAGLTPLAIAIIHNLATMCRLLIAFGHSVNRKQAWGERPLDMAVRQRAEKCAITLVHWGCRLSLAGRDNGDRQSYFQQAATAGMLRLTKLLVDVRPSFLNESWVREQDLPLALYHKPNFTEWLFQEAASPRSLLHQCRARILRSIGTRACALVRQLPLPSRLLGFLELSEHFPASMYRERPLTIDPCPYACASNCSRQQCRHLDFSDSADSSDG